MIDYPPVTIVMTTYFAEGPAGCQRREVAYRTLHSWEDNLRYAGQLCLHVSDDGSYCEFKTDWEFVTYSRQQQGGVGASLNAGFEMAFKTSPVLLHAVDDWLLEYEYDITSWVEVLMERRDVGMIRLGPPHPTIRGVAMPLTGNVQSWGLILDRAGFAFATRPALFHERFIKAYGWFDEGINALECERLYNERFCKSVGPDIVYALPHPWRHQDSPSLSGREPNGNLCY